MEEDDYLLFTPRKSSVPKMREDEDQWEVSRDSIEPLDVSVSTIGHYLKRVSGRMMELVQKHINSPKMSKKRNDDR